MVNPPAEDDEVELPEAPFAYQLLEIARDADISFFDLIQHPMHTIQTYAEMREIEHEEEQRRAVRMKSKQDIID